MTVNGIDVASYQNTAYDTTGLAFVIVKATEGTGYVNPEYAAQVATGRVHGLVVGHYHFVRPGSMKDQADFFLKHATIKAGDLVVLDWEDPGVSCAEKDAWIKDLQKRLPHNRVLLYCNLDYWRNRDTTSFCGDGLWIADPGARAGHPRVQATWTIHQYSESGGTDHNVANFADKAALLTWAAKGVKPKPPAKPKPPVLEPFPGAAFFLKNGKPAIGKSSPVFTAMGRRLIAKGFGRYYKVGAGPKLGDADVAAYEAYQRSLGYSGAAATWPPGKASWAKLGVPST